MLRFSLISFLFIIIAACTSNGDGAAPSIAMDASGNMIFIANDEEKAAQKKTPAKTAKKTQQSKKTDPDEQIDTLALEEVSSEELDSVKEDSLQTQRAAAIGSDDIDETQDYDGVEYLSPELALKRIAEKSNPFYSWIDHRGQLRNEVLKPGINQDDRQAQREADSERVTPLVAVTLDCDSPEVPHSDVNHFEKEVQTDSIVAVEQEQQALFLASFEEQALTPFHVYTIVYASRVSEPVFPANLCLHGQRGQFEAHYRFYPETWRHRAMLELLVRSEGDIRRSSMVYDMPSAKQVQGVFWHYAKVGYAN